MKTFKAFKAFEILKNPSKDCLRRSNKSWKPFPRKILTKETLYEKFQSLASLYQKTVSASPVKTCKRVQKAIFKCLELLLWPQDSFKIIFNCFTYQNLNSNQSEDFALLFQKMVSTLSLKNLQKSEMLFSYDHNIRLHLKVASKLIRKMLSMTNFRFKQF